MGKNTAECETSCTEDWQLLVQGLCRLRSNCCRNIWRCCCHLCIEAREGQHVQKRNWCRLESKVHEAESRMEAVGPWTGSTMVVLVSPLLLAALHLLQRTSAKTTDSESEVLEEKIYTGPEFIGYDCYQDLSPVRFQMPSLCRDETGHPLYGTKDKY